MKTFDKRGILQLLIRISEFLLALVIFIDMNTVYTEAIINNKLPTQSYVHTYAKIISSILVLLLIIFHVAGNSKNIEYIKEYKMPAAVLLLFALLFYVFNVSQTNDGEGYMISYFFLMIIFPLLFKLYRKEGKPFELFFVLERIVIFAAITSFIIWLGSSVLNLLGEATEIRVLWGGNYYDSNYINLCFRRYWEDDITKNLSIFAEPPMFGLFLNVALFTELFLKKRNNIYIVLVLLAAFVSNRATLALMVAIVALGLKVIELFWNKKWFKFVFCGVVLISIAGIVLLFVQKRNIASSSFNTHLDDYVAPLKCFINNNWLVGCGYDYLDPIIEYESAFRSNNPGMSNSIAPVLAQGGLMLSAYFLIPFITIIGSFFKKNKKLAFWGLGMLALYITVIFNNRVLVFAIISFGYSMFDIQIFKEKPFINISLEYPFSNMVVDGEDDNIKWYDKCKAKNGFIWPKEMTVASLLILFALSIYYLLNLRNDSAFTYVCSIVTIIAAVILFCWWLCGSFINRNIKYKISKVISFVCSLILWVCFICIGNVYSVIDSFLRSNHLLLQDSHWGFVIFVIVFYVLVTVVMYALESVGKTRDIKGSANE